MNATALTLANKLAIRRDFEDWTGGFAPDCVERITTYVMLTKTVKEVSDDAASEWLKTQIGGWCLLGREQATDVLKRGWADHYYSMSKEDLIDVLLDYHSNNWSEMLDRGLLVELGQVQSVVEIDGQSVEVADLF